MGNRHLRNVARSMLSQLHASPTVLGLDQHLADPLGHDRPTERIFEVHGKELARLVGRMRTETLANIIADGHAFTFENQRSGVTPLCEALGPGAKRITLAASGKSILRQLAAAALVAEMADILKREWGKVKFAVVEIATSPSTIRFFVTASHPSFGVRYLSHLGVWLQTHDGAMDFGYKYLAEEVCDNRRSSVGLRDIRKNLHRDDPARL